MRMHTVHEDNELILFYNIEASQNLHTIKFVSHLLMNFFERNFCAGELGSRRASECSWEVKEVPKEFSFFIVKLKLTMTGQRRLR